MNSVRGESRGGMILFEVMLATAIFCLVGVALSDGLGKLAEAVRSSNRENQIQLGLESHLAEAKTLPIQPGLQKEKPDADGVTYEREWKVLRMTNKEKAVLPGLYLLTIRARWSDRNQENVEEASLRLYRPQS
jgi:hypothetical protein